ncbi:MAG: FHA domain-containing protein [Glaciimonas sp.]|nr:FHA domain-containing protein [Glaciimonas sp.]
MKVVFFIEDNGSIFGTWIDGECINHLGPLNAGTEIRIGIYTLTLQMHRQGDESMPIGRDPNWIKKIV